MVTVSQKTIIRLSPSDIVATSDPIPVFKPSVVYHYTSIDTLRKILENKTLRLSNLYDTKDADEYKHGLELLRQRISDFEYRQQIPFAKRIPNSFFQCFFPPMELFFISFTTSGDDYAFWDSEYVDKNSPIAIGFDTKTLENVYLKINHCIYGDPYPEDISKIYYKFSRLCHNYDLIRGDQYFWELTFRPALTKNKIYEKEDEWRCVTPFMDFCQKTTFNRFGKECIGFFIPISLKSISSIVVGTCQNQESNYSIVRELTSQYGLSTNVIKSEAKIRFDTNPKQPIMNNNEKKGKKK